MFYNEKFMHINARDETPLKAFCFIIEYTPHIERVRGSQLYMLLIRFRTIGLF